MPTSQFAAELRRAAELIKQADSLLISAGAGMGIDSGLPDFRGNEGFWNAYPALGRQQFSFQQIASPDSFRGWPALAWGFYGHRLDLYRHTTPHQGFHLLKKWADEMSGGYRIFTSNVDGQFQKAGFAASQILECHGSIHYLQCSAACSGDTWSADQFIPELDQENCLLTNSPPVCPHCGAMARPNILMFNDSAWIETNTELQERRQNSWLYSTKRPVVIEIGAGPTISTVRNFSERTAKQFHGHLIRINPTHPNVSRQRDVRLAMNALDALQAIELMLHEPTSSS